MVRDTGVHLPPVRSAGLLSCRRAHAGRHAAPSHAGVRRSSVFEMVVGRSRVVLYFYVVPCRLPCMDAVDGALGGTRQTAQTEAQGRWRRRRG
eukprot:scaffold145018_cov142-Phaeocystis_antarctica.AAC.1